VILVLAVLTWVVYGQVAGFEFTNFDDPLYITGNSRTLEGLTWSNVAWAFTSITAANWHPLTWLSYMADTTLFGPDPGMFHLTSVVFHSANAGLLFLLLKRLTGDLWPSALVAALFAVHPLHVESVAWVAERKDVISMFILLLTLAAYVQGPTERRTRVATAILFVLGLMAKPMLVSLPLLLLFLDRWPLGRTAPWKDLIREKVPLFALAGASSLVTLLAQKSFGAVISVERLPMVYRLGNVPIAYVGYLWKMVWPVRLAPLYPFIPEDVTLWKSLGCLGLLLVAGALAFASRRRFPYLAMGLLWFLISLLPVIGLIQVGAQSMADRYTYIPLLGPFIIVAWGCRDLARVARIPSRVLGSAGLVVVGLLTVLARAQTAHWQDSLTLFRHEQSVAPDNIVTHTNLGQALFLKGRVTEAIAEYRLAVQLNPKIRIPQIDLARALAHSGQREEALACLKRWLEIRPTDHLALEDVTDLLLGMGRLEETLPFYNSFLALEPQRLKEGPDRRAQLAKSQDARMRIGLICRTLGRDAEAVPYFRAAAAAGPLNPSYALNLGISLAAAGRSDEARIWFGKVLAIQPGNADARARLQSLDLRSGKVRKAERGSS